MQSEKTTSPSMQSRSTRSCAFFRASPGHWLERNNGGQKVVLIPAPSDHPDDPLNWGLRKKYLTLVAVCFAAFAASCAPIAHENGYVAIALAYHRSPIQLTYTVSAGVAGLLGGPFLLAPFVKLIGRTAIIFWCLIIVIATQIWAGVSTRPSDYISFTMSRVFSGIFASIPSVIGSGYIIDMFFLHERGFAFASYELALLFGLVAAPTIGAFISNSAPWPVIFWWTIGPLGLAAILFAFYVDDTEFAPGRSERFTASPAKSYLARRVQYLTGANVIPPASARQVMNCFVNPFIIGTSPATIAAGFYIMVNFGWAIFVNIELAIFLQQPKAEGGYGFSAAQTAAFTITAWVSIIAAQVFGIFYNDRVPIWLSLRRKGLEGNRWHPEDRLWSMLLPATLSPIGLGLVGATLQYHLHYMVMALGWFFVAFSALLCIPVCVNYVIERYMDKPVEVSVAMSAYRQALGLALPFFFVPWQEAVGIGWVFGMAAFFTVFAMGVIALLAWKGSKLVGLKIHKQLARSEEGQKLVAE